MKIAMLGLKGIPAASGGVERHVEELSARLVQHGHEVTVYCRRRYTPDAAEHRGARLRILPGIATKHLDTLSHTALSVADSLRREFDIIHFHSVGPALLSFLPRLASHRPCGVVATVHAMDWRRRKWGPLSRWCLRRGAWAAVTFPHRTIVVSREMAEHFAARGKRAVHIPNGVETPWRVPLEELKRFGIEREGFLLWMGRFVPEKRVEDLVRAFRGIGGYCRLVLAGQADAADPYFRSVRAEAGDDKRILFPGGLYARARAEALSNAGLVVLPSELEGFPIVLLEAMRYGRPVLAGDIPANLEALAPGVNGFAFEVGNVASLRERIAWILAHPVEAAAAGLRAEQDARQYDWDPIALRTEAVYRAALEDAVHPKTRSS